MNNNDFPENTWKQRQNGRKERMNVKSSGEKRSLDLVKILSANLKCYKFQPTATVLRSLCLNNHIQENEVLKIFSKWVYVSHSQFFAKDFWKWNTKLFHKSMNNLLVGLKKVVYLVFLCLGKLAFQISWKWSCFWKL